MSSVVVAERHSCQNLSRPRTWLDRQVVHFALQCSRPIRFARQGNNHLKLQRVTRMSSTPFVRNGQSPLAACSISTRGASALIPLCSVALATAWLLSMSAVAWAQCDGGCGEVSRWDGGSCDSCSSGCSDGCSDAEGSCTSYVGCGQCGDCEPAWCGSFWSRLRGAGCSANWGLSGLGCSAAPSCIEDCGSLADCGYGHGCALGGCGDCGSSLGFSSL